MLTPLPDLQSAAPESLRAHFLPRFATAAGRPARVAVVHDWLARFYGPEQVLRAILRCFPEADLFTLIDAMDAAGRAALAPHPLKTSFLQRLPLARRRHGWFIPLMPLAVEQFDLTGYDLVLSSSHTFAKGVLTGADQLHVAYIHTPLRHAWDAQHDYLRQRGLHRGPLSPLARLILHRQRIWDSRTAHGVDVSLANSAFTARRIDKAYGAAAAVVHPPVAVAEFAAAADRQDYYLVVASDAHYKRTGLVIEAFKHLPERKLVVAGTAGERAALRRAAGANVTLLGYQEVPALRRLLAEARALIFAPIEDFGITPVEAQASGTPVIAYGRGGALETVNGLDHAQPTGVLFDEPSIESLIDAVLTFEQHAGAFSAAACVANAQRFRPEAFYQRYLTCIAEAWRQHPASGGPRFEPGARTGEQAEA